MRKLDDQVLTSYKKMLQKQDENSGARTEAKQSIFSPSKDKKSQHTPSKANYKTPLKNEVELQKYYSSKF
jgi:hypothetical protein